MRPSNILKGNKTMSKPSGQNPEDTRHPNSQQASRRCVICRILGVPLTIAGIAFLLISLVSSWLATDPNLSWSSTIGADVYSPLALFLNPNGLIIWTTMYLFALLGASALSLILLWTTRRNASPSLRMGLGWITVSCMIGVSITLVLAYLPRFVLSFEYSASRTDLGPGFFAALGGYAMVLLGSIVVHAGRTKVSLSSM